MLDDHLLKECPCKGEVDRAGPHVPGCHYAAVGEERASFSDLRALPVIDSVEAELLAVIRMLTGALRDASTGAVRAQRVLEEAEAAIDRLGLS